MRFLNDEYDNSVNKRYLVGKQLEIYNNQNGHIDLMRPCLCIGRKELIS